MQSLRAFVGGVSSRLCGAILLALALPGCAGIGGAAGPTATPSPGQSSAPDVQVIGSDFAVGSNRFTFTLSEHDRPLTSVHPMVYFFALQGFTAVPAGQGPATFMSLGTGGGQTVGGYPGLYVLHTTFDRSGKWGAEIDVAMGGKKNSLQTIFNVTKRSLTPAVGQVAPRSDNPTVPGEAVSRLDSGHPPDNMHRISIAAAIAHHRPLVVLFASAAYCGAFQCGPEIQVVQQLERQYRASVAFVHIDIFQNAHPPHLSSTAAQWHVPSQPWVFVVNRRGKIAAKFEGPAGASEIDAAIRRAVR